jgi:hypothetical protein
VILMRERDACGDIGEGVRIDGYLQKKYWSGMQGHSENASDGPVSNFFILVFFHRCMICGFTGNMDWIRGVYKN